MSRAEVLSIFERLHRQQDSASSAQPRVLFVYAHPDDEMIAVGGHLPLFRDALFFQVTDGAPADNADGDALGLSRDEYRAERALELRAAFAAAGMPEARHRSLNFSDKEAALHLLDLTRHIAGIIATEQPEAIFTHPYEGGHADHDACAFAVHQAVALLPTPGPLIVESPFYFADANGTVQAGTFLNCDEDSTLTLPLSPEAQQRKRNAFHAFATQQRVLTTFNASLTQERFRVAPLYNFTEPATTDPAHYESFIATMTATLFTQLAAETIAVLQAAQPEPVAA